MPRTSGERRKPLLLGEAPSKSGDRYHAFPLSGRVAETLCRMAGIPPEDEGSRYGRWTWALYDHFECENLIERWPGAQGNGSAFPMMEARMLAQAKQPELIGRVVVLLGARLPKAFDAPTGFYEWHDLVELDISDGYQVVSIPHPSGLNRMLNDPSERDRCGSVLREALERAKVVDC